MKTAFRRLIRPLLEIQVKRLIARHNLKVVAVSGSVGKTSTKIAIATVLSEKYRVLNQTGYFSNFNSEIGLPLSVFQLHVPQPIFNPFAWIWRLIQMEGQIRGEYTSQVLVLELGTEHPGELRQFMTYLSPQVGVVTAIAPEHMEFFKTIEAVGEEEFTIARGSQQAVLNSAFDRLHPLARNLKTEPIWYSAQDLKPYEHKLKREFSWDESLWPEHIRQAMGAAVIVAEQFKLNADQITRGLANFNGVPGRMQRLTGSSDTLLIDDTYNSSPDAAYAALSYLDSMAIRPEGRRIVIMGQMNELGTNSPRYHAEVGTAFAGVDYLITIGDIANDSLGPAAVAAGLDPTRFRPADSPYAAGEYVKLIARPGDIILVKGSQNGVFAEEAVKILLANPNDQAKLVRQSPSWEAIKRSQFPDAEKYW
jgi:UDP-N-acetylmuramoyl-tripeptide--D-alanyl-D-alanine ligase